MSVAKMQSHAFTLLDQLLLAILLRQASPDKRELSNVVTAYCCCQQANYARCLEEVEGPLRPAG